MKILKASNKNGQSILWSASRCEGHTLNDIYNSWSYAKQQAYNDCIRWFNECENSHTFRVGNGNTFGFCACWYCDYEGERALRYETKNNTYIVLLNR